VFINCSPCDRNLPALKQLPIVVSSLIKKGLMESQNTESRSNRRVLVGKVVSTKMDKTVVVEVERRVMHPKYGKFVRSRSKYHAHDENNTCELNQVVSIQESRPYSKLKRWLVIS
jgi:small subunit ribosomal protein S17